MEERKTPKLAASLEEFREQVLKNGEQRALGGRRRIFVKPSFEMALKALLKEFEKKGWERQPTQQKIGDRYVRDDREGREEP